MAATLARMREARGRVRRRLLCRRELARTPLGLRRSPVIRLRRGHDPREWRERRADARHWAPLKAELAALRRARVPGRVILAHLGNGASLAAVRGATSLDTSMGFTPAAGLVMGTRTGDLDPGVVAFLAHTEQMTALQFHDMVNHESGLLGVSETSSDMRDLLTREGEDVRAAEAVALFCYQAKKWIGAFAAALGGLDTLVFSAGIGERSAAVRARICEGLGFVGIELHDSRNAAHAAVISTDVSGVAVRVIPTDEELMIARSTSRLLRLGEDITDTEI